MTKTAILYARVSTQEQYEHGYSLRQQIEALRDYAETNGYRVLEEVKDSGFSGASLNRPGLNRVRDLVAAGGVDLVLAQERDRISREPAYHYVLRNEFADYGTALRALNDSADGSPTGDLTDGILDQIAKFQRLQFAHKSRQNKIKKAREGKVMGSGTPPYGFRYNADRTKYKIDEQAMAVVRRIFRMVGAEGQSLHAVKKTFEREGVSPSGRGRSWLLMSIRRTIRNDVYRPHGYDEVKDKVSPDVAAGLKPDRSYGIAWYGRERVTLTPDGKKRRSFQQNPRSEWVAIPIPDAGVPRDHVDAARAALDGQTRKPKPGDSRTDLERLKGGQQRLRQLKAQKRFILETFGQGMKLGLMWFPPQMRRAIHQMLRLKITVSGDGTIWAEADVDANVIRLTRDVEEYARRLNEAK